MQVGAEMEFGTEQTRVDDRQVATSTRRPAPRSGDLEKAVKKWQALARGHRDGRFRGEVGQPVPVSEAAEKPSEALA